MRSTPEGFSDGAIQALTDNSLEIPEVPENIISAYRTRGVRERDALQAEEEQAVAGAEGGTGKEPEAGPDLTVSNSCGCQQVVRSVGQ